MKLSRLPLTTEQLSLLSSLFLCHWPDYWPDWPQHFNSVLWPCLCRQLIITVGLRPEWTWRFKVPFPVWGQLPPFFLRKGKTLTWNSSPIYLNISQSWQKRVRFIQPQPSHTPKLRDFTAASDQVLAPREPQQNNSYCTSISSISPHTLTWIAE